MKKIITLILTLAMAVSLLSSCSIFGLFADSGEMTVIVESEDGSYTAYSVSLGEVKNKAEGVAGVLEHLRDREEEPLALDMSDSTYGKYVYGIGGIAEDPTAGKYIPIYTSLEKDFGTWEDVGTIEYEGITLKSAGVGISSMTVESGIVVLFRLEVYSW